MQSHPRWALSGIALLVDMADWEEIRQLAADLRRVQESTSAHKLSERNCIELVTRLVDTGRLQVLYTLDGKEYVTPQQLEKEIKGELVAHRGEDVHVCKIIISAKVIRQNILHSSSKYPCRREVRSRFGWILSYH